MAQGALATLCSRAKHTRQVLLEVSQEDSSWNGTRSRWEGNFLVISRLCFQTLCLMERDEDSAFEIIWEHLRFSVG